MAKISINLGPLTRYIKDVSEYFVETTTDVVYYDSNFNLCSDEIIGGSNFVLPLFVLDFSVPLGESYTLSDNISIKLLEIIGKLVINANINIAEYNVSIPICDFQISVNDNNEVYGFLKAGVGFFRK